MLSTCICGTLIYSNQSPLNSLALSPVFESSLMGIAMATTAFLVMQSPFGRRSGAHINPAVTLTFFWLGRMHQWDAAFYVAAQFGGAVAGVLAARGIVGLRLSAAPVQYTVTLRGQYGSAAAFVFEFLLSVLLMSTVLYTSNHRLFARFTPALVALLTVLYFVLSSSISGFSVNPARSFSSALFAWIWPGIWIYFSAPCLGMLTAAAIYVKGSCVLCESLSRHAVNLPVSLSFPAGVSRNVRLREFPLWTIFILSLISRSHRLTWCARNGRKQEV